MTVLFRDFSLYSPLVFHCPIFCSEKRNFEKSYFRNPLKLKTKKSVFWFLTLGWVNNDTATFMETSFNQSNKSFKEYDYS